MDIQWSLVLFTVLTGAGGMLFFFIGLNTLLGKTDKGEVAGSIASLALIVVGGLCSVTHLSHPTRMLNALQHPTSGIFTEAVLVGLLACVLIVFLIMVKREMRGAGLSVVAVIGMVLGVLLSFMAGQSYLMVAITAWNTELLPLGYLGTALAEGAAAYVVLLAATKADRAAASFFGVLLLAAGCISLATTALYGVVSGAFASEVGALYVIGALLAGGAAPAVAGFMVWKKPEQAMTWGVIGMCFCRRVGVPLRHVALGRDPLRVLQPAVALLCKIPPCFSAATMFSLWESRAFEKPVVPCQ